ncbi:hypothetical protein DSECCO2_432320 [anaerobic digester metagenome]
MMICTMTLTNKFKFNKSLRDSSESFRDLCNIKFHLSEHGCDVYPDCAYVNGYILHEYECAYDSP